MGQKVSAHGLRVGVIKDWDATWYANKKDFAELLKEDNTIREYIQKKYHDAQVSRVTIERTDGKVTINIITAKPGMIIGSKGAGIDALNKAIKKIAVGKQVTINVKEVKKPDTDATINAQSIAAQIEKRILVKRAIKSTLQKVMKAGALGCKIAVAGRINGAEIARTEQFALGSVPLHTIRADIDYGFAEAHTTYGVLGVKVWIYKGEVLEKPKKNASVKGGEK
ncbi:MAG: 30S ribosomal protein S3 [Firmicutes bacterium]|nr:30S ribosomal protein S3 [Bacillota bacterium]